MSKPADADEPTAVEGVFHPHNGRAEWVMMWAAGIEPRVIAQRCGVTVDRVNRAVGKALDANPQLGENRPVPVRPAPRRRLHDRPELPAELVAVRQFDKRLQEYVAYEREHGRPPSQNAVDPRARSLNFWLSRQRAKDRAGTLAPQAAAKLDEALGSWRQPPKAWAERTRFNDQISRLRAFVAETGTLPRNSSARSGDEQDLAVWLRSRRVGLRSGRLPEWQREELDDCAPGWDDVLPDRQRKKR